MIPIRRDFRFHLPRDEASSWHHNGAAVSHFFNALSVFFPVGERFFIRSVRNYRERISDPKLRDAVTVFIGQEAMHGREHEDYNRLLQAAGLPAESLERVVESLLGTVQKITPAAWQLSTTIALEHFTAILADRLLDDDRMLGRASPEFKNLWLWHALEETEHKAVAFNVWREMMGNTKTEHALRSAGMLVTGAAFVALVASFSVVMIEQDGRQSAQPHSRPASYAALARFLLGRNGLVRSGIPAWLDYFDRDFHPWQHDNTALLGRLGEIEKSRQTRGIRAPRASRKPKAQHAKVA